MSFDATFWSLLRDPDGTPLTRMGDVQLSHSGKSFPIVAGIPRFVSEGERGQEQVRSTFAYKWNRTPQWGISDATSEVMTNWIMPLLGWQSETDYAAHTAGAKVMLDAGCGNGRETIRLARLNPQALVAGIDISDAVDVAAKNAEGLKNVRFIQGDLCTPPLAAGKFDFILSFGVLHHTPDTRRAFLALVPLISDVGEFTFYVYRKKAPIREFSDDFLRAEIRSMSPAQGVGRNGACQASGQSAIGTQC